MQDETQNAHSLTLNGVELLALSSGALWWPDQAVLCVSDLHLGKSERIARRGGSFLPPYEGMDTLHRLAELLDIFDPRHVICLGDSFDDLSAAYSLTDELRLEIAKLQSGREWTWIEGNHDPGPVELGGEHLTELALDGLVFRHIAQAGVTGEISGHYHPKARIRTRAGSVTRPAFLFDMSRIILPAFGTYTGGLRSDDPAFFELFSDQAIAILTGRQAFAVPMPRGSSTP